MFAQLAQTPALAASMHHLPQGVGGRDQGPHVGGGGGGGCNESYSKSREQDARPPYLLRSSLLALYQRPCATSVAAVAKASRPA